MPRTRPPHVLRCAVCHYETARVRGRPPKECPKCGQPLTAVRIPRDVARAMKAAA